MTSSLFSDGDNRSVASLDVFDDPLLDTDVVPLDEVEFDIPEFLQLPTLDDVLSETYEFSPFSSPKKALPRHLQRRDSSSSFGSIDSLPVQSSSDNVVGASLVRHVKLKGVSANILSAHRRDAGFPSAITAGNTIAIGTSHGYILLFDSKQLLRFFLQPSEEVGGISALSFNVDSNRLLAGHDRGVVNMWDTENGKILRVVKDIIGSAVLHVKFTDDPTKAIMSNGTGSVFLMSFKRPMGVRVCESKVIFSGSKGEVVCVEPLIISNRISNHILNSYNPYLIAMATLTKVFIISLKPKIAVVFSYMLKGNVSTLPVISWQFIKLQVNHNNPVLLEPVIVFGRDSKIVFALVDTSNIESINVRILKTLDLNYSLTNLIWFNSKTIAVSDQMENLRLLDIQTEEIVETLDLEPVQLVYATSAFKGIMNEIGVSAALNAASSFACYYSMTMAFDQLLVLGQESLHVFVIRTWSERVNVYRKQKLYLPAISLCRQIYQGTSKALVGPLGPEKSFLIQSTEKLLLEYTSLLLASSPQQSSSGDDRETYFNNFIPFIVDTCCLMKIWDILNDVYSHLERDSASKFVFLSTVQSYILSSSITKISPFILKDLVNQNIELQQIAVIQDLILKLEIETIDIDQIVKLSWQHKLFDAIIYLYNRAMKNYSVPLEELTDFLRNKDPNNRELVNKILLYLSCCMTGRDITYGDVPEPLRKNAKIQAWKFLLFDQPNSGSYKDRFPNSKLLLLQDTREFLNVLSITFGEPEFTSAEGQRVRQRIIDMIMLLIEKCESEFTSAQLGSVYIFLARELMKSSLNLEGEVFNQIVSYLTTTRPELSGTKIERERVITELIISGVLDLHDEDLEQKLLNACFYSVLEFIYEKRGEYHKMLRCFCQVTERNKVVFRFIRSILYQLDYVTEQQKSLLINEINHNITTLIQIDPARAAHLLLVELKLPVDRVTSQLSVDHDSQIVFQFLSGVVELIAREKISLTHNITPEHPTSVSGQEHFSSGNNHQMPSNSSPVEDDDNGQTVAPWVREVVRKYIKLAAALDPEALEKFVRKSAALVSIEDAMQICEANNSGDLVAYLHVRAGNHLKAMKVFVNYVDKLISKFLKYDAESDTCVSVGGIDTHTGVPLEAVYPLSFKQVERQVRKCASLLREMIVSHHVAEKEVQNAWFALLDAVVTPVKCKWTEAVWSAEFKDLLFALLNSMIGYISLPSIMKKVFADPAYDTGTYEDVKDLVTGMFETCRYEHTLLSITSNLLNQDIFTKFQSLTLSSIRGVRPLTEQCGICLKELSQPSSTALIIVFSCRHSYHLDCLERNESWEETFVEVDGLPERKIVHFCIICKSRTDPNFESRRSFPPKSAASFHSEDNRSNFTFSRQKSSSHSFSQVEDRIDVVLRNQRRTRRILTEDQSSSTSSGGPNVRTMGAGSSWSGYGQVHNSSSFTAANAAFRDRSSSFTLNLKPVIRSNKSVFDSCD